MGDKVLNCGHEPTQTDGVGTGIAQDSETGREMCYPCADTDQREKLKTADAFTGYVSEAKRVITTWPGGELAKVTSLATGRVQYTPSGGRYRMRTVEAVTPDGVRWKGRGSDGMDAITMRRIDG